MILAVTQPSCAGGRVPVGAAAAARRCSRLGVPGALGRSSDPGLLHRMRLRTTKVPISDGGGRLPEAGKARTVVEAVGLSQQEGHR